MWGSRESKGTRLSLLVWAEHMLCRAVIVPNVLGSTLQQHRREFRQGGGPRRSAPCPSAEGPIEDTAGRGGNGVSRLSPGGGKGQDRCEQPTLYPVLGQIHQQRSSQTCGSDIASAGLHRTVAETHPRAREHISPSFEEPARVPAAWNQDTTEPVLLPLHRPGGGGGRWRGLGCRFRDWNNAVRLLEP